MPPMNTRVHQVLAQNGSVVFPGVYDTLSAKIVQGVGFPRSFISGYSVAATAIGEPDLGLLTQNSSSTPSAASSPPPAPWSASTNASPKPRPPLAPSPS